MFVFGHTANQQRLHLVFIMSNKTCNGAVCVFLCHYKIQQF